MTRNRKIKIITLLFAILFSLLLIRVFYIQISMETKLLQWVRKYIHPKKGDIYDRNGKRLTDTVQVTSIFAEPHKIKNPNDTAEKLSEILNLDTKFLLRRLTWQNRYFVWVARHVDKERVEKIKELGIVGIGFLKEPKRYYLYNSTAAHLLGFCGIDVQGLYGLEKIYENYLEGRIGSEIYYPDVYGKPIPHTYHKREAEDGKNLITTIDLNLQKEVEKILDSSIKKHYWQTGAAIVFEPETGEILALSIRPTFDPNNFLKYKKEIWQKPVIYREFTIKSTLENANIINKLLLKLKQLVKSDIDKLIPAEQPATVKKSNNVLTPVDLLKIISVIANSGTCIEVHVLKEIRDADWKVIKKFEAQKVKEIIYNKELEKITRLLLSKKKLDKPQMEKLEDLHFEGILYSVDNSKDNILFHSYIKFLPDKKPEYTIIFFIQPHIGIPASTIAREIISQLIQKCDEYYLKNKKF